MVDKCNTRKTPTPKGEGVWLEGAGVDAISAALQPTAEVRAIDAEPDRKVTQTIGDPTAFVGEHRWGVGIHGMDDGLIVVVRDFTQVILLVTAELIATGETS